MAAKRQAERDATAAARLAGAGAKAATCRDKLVALSAAAKKKGGALSADAVAASVKELLPSDTAEGAEVWKRNLSARKLSR